MKTNYLLGLAALISIIVFVVGAIGVIILSYKGMNPKPFTYFFLFGASATLFFFGIAVYLSD